METWKELDFKSTVKRNNSQTPYVTISPKNGKISLNRFACNLISELMFFDCVGIFEKTDESNNTYIGFRFMKDNENNTFKATIPIKKIFSPKESINITNCQFYSKALTKVLEEKLNFSDADTSAKFKAHPNDSMALMICSTERIK